MQDDIKEIIFKVVDEQSTRLYLIVDCKYIIVYANNALCRLWGKGQADVVGQSLLDLVYDGSMTDEEGKYHGPLIETIKTGKEFLEQEVCLKIAGIGSCWYLADTCIIHSSEGTRKYAVGKYDAIDRWKSLERRIDTINLSVIKSFSKAVGTRDPYTMQHSESVARLLTEFCEYMGLSVHDMNRAFLAGIVHDIGKIGVLESILNKLGPLTEEEYALMKQHAPKGAEILEGIDGFEEVAHIVRHHHERYDGTGYPEGLANEQIPLLSRMMTVCDSYDAMTSERIYRKACSPTEALLEIERCSGTQFDPEIARKFCEYIQMRSAHEERTTI
jgi:putative nucleotidyltransferase with HDIG domain